MSVFGYVYPGADSHRGLRSQILTRYWELDFDHLEEQEISLITEQSHEPLAPAPKTATYWCLLPYLFTSLRSFPIP